MQNSHTWIDNPKYLFKDSKNRSWDVAKGMKLMPAYLTMTSELCFLLANWMVKMACDLDDLLFRGVSATLLLASLCSSKFCAIFSLAARCVDKLRTRHEPLTPSTTATCDSRKNKHHTLPIPDLQNWHPSKNNNAFLTAVILNIYIITDLQNCH